MQKQGSNDVSQGRPALDYLAYLQDNWTPDDIADAKATVKKVKLFAVTADASAGLEITGVPVGAVIIGVHVIATAGNTLGTLKLRDNAASPNDITDAMVCATDKAVVYASSIDDAFYTVDADGLSVIAGGTDATATRGIVVIEYV
jgi:hypothetical protein